MHEHLADLGVDIGFAIGGKDLGVHLAGLRQRRLGILGARLSNSSRTLVRISKLATHSRRAFKLIK